MTCNLLKKVFFLSFFALVACAGHDSNSVPVLPDDPAVEQPSQGQNGQSSQPESTVVETPVASAPVTVSSNLDPNHLVPAVALSRAVAYFDANRAHIANQNYMTVIDYSKSSTKARMFIINMKTGAVWAIHNAHGKGSDPDHDGLATKFSNVSGSNATSLGYYLTAETYYGSHGLSLRLDGLSTTNSNARERAIVIHGASYVQEAAVIQGRSWGCPAVSMDNRDKVISLLKGGSLIYAYYN